MHWGRGVDSRGKGGRGGGEKGCPQMPHHFLWLCLSMGVRKGRSDRTGVEEVRAVRGHPSSLKAKHPTGARQPDGNPQESADTHRQKSAEAANPQPPDPGTGKPLAQRLTAPWGCSCLESAERPRRRCGRGLGGRGLQRPESAEGPRPRCPSFFSFPPARRSMAGDHRWRCQPRMGPRARGGRSEEKEGCPPFFHEVSRPHAFHGRPQESPLAASREEGKERRKRVQ